ncbi:hypothetical protein RM844_30390 [Streptomyces sp. DSM 44915]|uniref:Minor tail protein n=1 Tax=Streptomyces chisholmiae TaxID=3075540 RepID=A0ABU2K0R3_9ACTN|nr:hypothetical protein [Streptomyces sp. DSM 44915]MDT0270591.1 hypothetical protein [Streptomyces sp. DSM 44915]
MTYPTRPWWTPVRLELAFGADPASDPAAWQWTDVSADLDRAQSLTISRGRPDESGQTRPAGVSARLVNNNSAYTPGHPASPHYPHVRQGVPARVSVQAGGPHLRVPGAAGGRARVESSPALDVTDLDVRVEWAPDRVPATWGATAPGGQRPWAPAIQEIIGRYAVPTARMWVLQLGLDGRPRLTWSTTGADVINVDGDVAIASVSGQQIALRATLDVDDGAGQHLVAFWSAPTLAGPWRRLGAPVVRPGVTSIYQAGSAPLDLGDVATLAWTVGAGRYYRAELRSSIDGPPVAAPDFTAAAPGDTAVTDPQGNVWTLAGGAEVTDWRVRMTGEVADWAPTWPWGDLSDPSRPGPRPGEARCDITIAGPLRRLGQGAKGLQSTLRRRIPSYDPVAYWPMEEDRGATQAYSPIEGVSPMVTSGLQFAAVDSLPGSGPLPTLASPASIRGVVPAAPAGQWRVELVYRLEQMPSEAAQMLDVRTTGGPWGRFEIRVTTTTVQVIGYDTNSESSSSALLINVSAVRFTGAWCRLSLSATASGGTVTATLRWLPIGDTGLTISESYTGTVGRVTQVGAAFGAALQGMPIGHITVFPTAATAAFDSADHGFTGETAVARMRRLAEEERLPMSVLGAAGESPTMGPQRPATLLTLLQECADADGGLLAERREGAGLMYRPRQVLYNQTPGVVLSARSNEIDNPFSPVLDDQRLRNDITVSRDGGSSARAVDDASVTALGLYDESVTVNVEADGQLGDIAAWRLHRGTWPGMRYPAATSALDVAPEVIAPWLDRLEGDRVQVRDLPPQHPDEVVDLLTEGLIETLTPTRWSIEAAASPGGPWTVGEVGEDDPDEDDAPVHVDTDGTVLAVAATETATVLYLRTTAGPEWVTTNGPTGGQAEPGDLPVDLSVAGEIVRATRIEPLAWDIYDRTVTGGWGSTTTGLAWTSNSGPAGDRSVAAGEGIITLSSPTTTPRFQLLPFGISDCQVLVTITPSTVATGAALAAGVIMRVSGSAYYRVRVLLGTSGAISMDAARASNIIGATAPTPYTYAGGSALRLRARLDGDRIRARVWPAQVLEPDVWWLDRTVTTDPVPVGFIGVVAGAEPGNTNASPQLAFSDWQIVNPQYAAVQRSINGIARAHPAGADVRLAHPMIVAL